MKEKGIIPDSTSANDNPNGILHIKEKPPKEKKRKIAIVGTAESQKDAPYKDESFEIWGLQVNLTYPTFTRYNRLYEMHYKDYWNTQIVLDRFAKVPENITIWMQEEFPEIKQSKRYPLEEVIEGYHDNFTSSIAYMLAHAAYEQKTLGNIELVQLFGVHMMADEEYSHQRPGCEYWLGILEALGVKVEVKGAGAVLKCAFKYGYDKEWKLLSELSTRKQQLDIGLKDLERKLEEIKSHYHQQEGAIKDVDWAIRRIQ